MKQRLVCLLLLVTAGCASPAPPPPPAASDEVKAEGVLRKANQLVAGGDLDAAIICFSEAIKLDPTLSLAYVNRATC